MSSRLQQISELITCHCGSDFLERNDDIPHQVYRILLKAERKEISYVILWNRLDSLLFNSLYQYTHESMLVPWGSGMRRVTSNEILDLADRLLSISYAEHPYDPLLQDQLYDLSRNGSFAAMRTLLSRYPLDEDEKQMIAQVLIENQQEK